jgi:hypothetical protein
LSASDRDDPVAVSSSSDRDIANSSVQPFGIYESVSSSLKRVFSNPEINKSYSSPLSKSQSTESIPSSLSVEPSTVIISGMLKVKRSGTFKKRYVVLDDKHIFVFKKNSDVTSNQNYFDNLQEVEKQPQFHIDLMCATVRVDKELEFYILTTENGSIRFAAETEKEILKWTALIEVTISFRVFLKQL